VTLPRGLEVNGDMHEGEPTSNQTFDTITDTCSQGCSVIMSTEGPLNADPPSLFWDVLPPKAASQAFTKKKIVISELP
jgi:hypothetical protein